MNAYTIVLNSIETAGNTLQKLLGDFPLESVNERAHESMFTTHEAVNHLTECYVAFAAEVQGQQYEWGTYTPGGTTYSEAVSEMFQKRHEVTQLVSEESDEATLTTAVGFLVSHDWYHIGQIATNRQAFQPSWNSYALYS